MGAGEKLGPGQPVRVSEEEVVAVHRGGAFERVPRESLQAIFERSTAPLSTGGGPRALPRRTITFVVDHTLCAPGVFAEDFELTLASLTPELELEAVNASGTSAAMGFEMARRTIVAFNGQALGAGQDEWLWRALDQGGRQLVVVMYAELGTAREEVAGKAKASLRFGTL